MACAGAVWQARFWWRLAGQHPRALLLGGVLQQTVRPLVVRRCNCYWDVLRRVVVGEHLWTVSAGSSPDYQTGCATIVLD